MHLGNRSGRHLGQNAGAFLRWRGTPDLLDICQSRDESRTSRTAREENCNVTSACLNSGSGRRCAVVRAGGSAGSGRILQRQDDNVLRRAVSGRRLRHQCTARCQAYRPAHSRQSASDRAQHAGRRRSRHDQLRRQRGGQGRAAYRGAAARGALRAAAGRCQPRQVRYHEAELARLDQHRYQRRRRQFQDRHQDLAGPEDARDGGCRYRRRHRKRGRAVRDPQRARAQVQGDRRLSRWQRDEPCHGPRRGRRPRHVLVDQHPADAQGPDRQRQARHPVPDGRQKAP